jgi:hypothetical protein
MTSKDTTDPNLRFPRPLGKPREVSSTHASSPVTVSIGNGGAASGTPPGPGDLLKWWQLIAFLLTIALAAGIVVAKVDSQGDRIEALDRKLDALMLRLGVPQSAVESKP